MYTSEIDEHVLSRLYDMEETVVKKMIDIVDRYSDECVASVVVRIRNECKIDLKNWKHTLLIGHIIGVVSSGIFEKDLLKNLQDLCQRQN